MKKAFSLVELLIVIGILAILMGVLVAALNGGTESARAARCLTNMKNLATACNTYGMAAHHYPLAGSIESREIDTEESADGIKFNYYEIPGWISWNSRGSYPSTSHVSSGSWFTSAYEKDEEVRDYALTNGALWKYLSGNTDVFVCPAHRKTLNRLKPLWSYVMNQYFGYDYTLGAKAIGGWIEYGHLSRADRILMFAELQFLGTDDLTVDDDTSPGIKNDCTLQYSHNEIIGCNHPAGKRGLCAHVVFADGHVEKLTIPASHHGDSWALNVSRSDLENLTEWLCKGKDVSFNGQHYEKLQD
ncbi:MAG: DUF1559 domain-containing protein [Kiritimatiellae bacterium]|nr:DUF1559 domain-containing protein [Kiritimatiellia bacterium]